MDYALRLVVIGQVVLIAMVLVARGPRGVSLPVGLLMASVAAYMIKTSPELLAAAHLFSAPIITLCWGGPYLVWYCAYALFDFERPPIWLMAVFPTATVALCGYDMMNVNAPTAVQAMSILTSLAVVLHAVYNTIRGSLDDLSQKRRQFRLCFVGCITVISVIILSLELIYVGQPEPTWLPLTIVSILAVAVLLLGVPLLTRASDLLPDSPREERDDSKLDRAEQEIHGRLLQAMDRRAYARTGLTIRQLAEELRLPEHHLRTLINARLGYKNFSTFLNSYRIEEAGRRLADPKEARVPVLTIALDAGFASLAPFNRAFKLAHRMTPSEHRRAALAPVDAIDVVTPIRR